MNENKISHFKKKLEEELKVVERELNELGWKNPRTGEWEATPGDIDTMAPQADANEAADKIEEYEEHRDEIEPLEARHTDIKDALQKIEDGVYGICEKSGEPIEENRLEANPAARTCKAHM